MSRQRFPRQRPLDSRRAGVILAGATLAAAISMLLAPLPGSSTASAQESVAFPETRVGEIAAAYIEAFNSGDPEYVREMELKYRAPANLEERPIEQRLQRYPQMHQALGILRPRVLDEVTPTSLTVLAESDGMGGWVSIRFSLDDADPPMLDVVAIRPAADPAASEADLSNWTDLSDLVATVQAALGTPALAVAVADNETILDAAVSGVRRADRDQEARVEDGFHIGSITKSMTATVVGALVEAGSLNWDDTLGDLTNEISLRPEYRGVRVLELLQHRAGISPELTYDDSTLAHLVGLPGTPTEQRRAFLEGVMQLPPIATPGTSMTYSNAGYVLAGFLAETRSGQSWDELIRRHVFEPAGMSTGGFGWPADADSSQPRGHWKTQGSWIPQGEDEYALGSFMAPAGDVHCSAADLARYGQMHLRGLLGTDGPLQAETIRTLHSPPEIEQPMAYACGWAIRETPAGRPMHWHNGSAGTFHAALAIFPEQRIVIASLANGADGGIDPTLDRMYDAILEKLRPATE